jgi:hypothetical protein
VRISANLVTSPFLGKLACAFGMMVALAPMGSAAPPAAGGAQEVQVEVWYGMRRIDREPGKPLEVDMPKQQDTPEPEKSARTVESVLENVLPTGIRKWLPCLRQPNPKNSAAAGSPRVMKHASWLDALQACLDRFPDTPQTVSGVVDSKRETKPAFATLTKDATIEAHASRSGDLAEAQETTSAESAPGAMTAEQVSDSADEQFFSKTAVQVACIFAVAIAAPLVSIISFFWLLRLHSRRFGPLFRIDYLGSPATVTGPFYASAPAVASQENLALDRGGKLEDLQGGDKETDAPPAQQAPFEPSEPAPAVVEERGLQEGKGKNQDKALVLKKGKRDRQEKAVVQKLFEENLRLREEIEQATEQDEPKDL